VICKRDKKTLYRLLTKQLGDPKTMTMDKRENLINLLGGWLGQVNDPNEVLSMRRRHRIPYPSRHKSSDTKQTIYEKHATKARWCSDQPAWHWKVDRLVQLPKQTDSNKKLGVPALPSSSSAPAGSSWDWIRKGTGKHLQIMIPMNYHLTVQKNDLCIIDRKIIQRVWNYRAYSDKEVWECTYWDFTKLGRDESSWAKAKWKTGFVVKMAVASAVEESLSRALSMAQSRVVRMGINSILSDTDE